MSLDIVKVSIVVSKIYFDGALVEPECNSGKFRIMSFSPSVASFIFVCLFKVTHLLVCVKWTNGPHGCLALWQCTSTR